MSSMYTLYYVVMLDGVPEAVSSTYQMAALKARELSTRSREATVVPVTPVEMTDDSADFTDEDPTTPF